MIKRIRKIPDWEKIFTKDTFDQRPLPKAYKTLRLTAIRGGGGREELNENR